MHEQEVELCVGDVVRIGDHLLTVVDIDGEDVSFRMDHIDESPLAFEAVTAEWPRK